MLPRINSGVSWLVILMHVVDQTQSHGSDPTWKIITWRQALPGSLCHYCITFGSLCNIIIDVYVYYLLWMRIQRVWSLNLKPSGPAGYFFLSWWPRLPIRTTGVLVTSTGVGDSLCGWFAKIGFLSSPTTMKKDPSWDKQHDYLHRTGGSWRVDLSCQDWKALASGLSLAKAQLEAGGPPMWPACATVTWHSLRSLRILTSCLMMLDMNNDSAFPLCDTAMYSIVGATQDHTHTPTHQYTRHRGMDLLLCFPRTPTFHFSILQHC